MSSRLSSLVATCALSALACSAGSTSAPVSTPPSPEVAPVPAQRVADDARGGRLYDRWTAEASVEAAPGQVRLKTLYGWDLRGNEGIYGPDYQNKSDVLARNLLSAQQSEAELIVWLSAGDDDLPALGDTLDAAALEDLASFIAKTQRGELPGPTAFFTLSASAPNNYDLVPGADAAAGKSVYADACAHCHGDDGTEIVIDETLSLGAFMRTKAYEGWFKVLHGHPGSPMGREVEFETAEQGASVTLSILAALCDRQVYPPAQGQSDVPDGDLRCGDYLR